MGDARMPSAAYTRGFPLPTRASDPLIAYGDPDDHLRLACLLAQRAKNILQDEDYAPQIDICMSPGSSWPAKLDALTVLLRALPAQSKQYPLVFLDIDALFTGILDIPTRWDDRALRAARADFLEVMVGASSRGNWHLIRPSPSPDVTSMIDEASISSHDSRLARIDTDSIYAKVRPEVVRILRWLLENEILSATTAQDVVDSGSHDDVAHHLVFLAYDSLRPSVRVAANRLASLRPPQLANGHYGPFAVANVALTDDTLSIEALSQLQQCGFIQRLTNGANRLFVPRSVRSGLSSYADSLGDPSVHADHLRFSRQQPDLSDVEAAIEVHHHAVKAGDAARATETAYFYVTDLRALATRLSLERKWAEAALVYQSIVDADPLDAYAWEYLGYNLARSDEPIPERILDAYERASDLEGSNPLFRGRLVGYLAERDCNIGRDFGPDVSRFYGLYGVSGISYFAEPVIKGLRRAHRWNDIQELRTRWGSFLFKSSRIASLLGD